MRSFITNPGRGNAGLAAGARVGYPTVRVPTSDADGVPIAGLGHPFLPDIGWEFG